MLQLKCQFKIRISQLSTWRWPVVCPSIYCLTRFVHNGVMVICWYPSPGHMDNTPWRHHQSISGYIYPPRGNVKSPVDLNTCFWTVGGNGVPTNPLRQTTCKIQADPGTFSLWGDGTIYQFPVLPTFMASRLTLLLMLNWIHHFLFPLTWITRTSKVNI